MEKDSQIKENIEGSKLLFTVSLFAFIGISAVTLLILFTGVISKWAGLDTYAIGIIPFMVAMLFAVAAAIFGKLSAAADYEAIEKKLLRERKDSAFDTEGDVRFGAGHTFDNYSRFAPYVMSGLSILVITTLLVLFAREWGGLKLSEPKNSLHVAFICVLLMFLSAFAGAFCLGQSRAKFFRWLRPVGAWLIAAFIAMILASVSALLYRYGKPAYDHILARVLFGFFVVLDVELVINLITEFYRPRTIEEVRPVYESRILALFTEPGGVMRNIADALDYQFGFKISKTALYSFFERAFLPMLLLWALLLWLFTGIVEVNQNEVGFRVRFGRVINDKPLEPNIYYKLPYPLETIVKASCTEIHEVRVGSTLEVKDGKPIQPDIVLWTVKHYASEKEFLVAVRNSEGKDSAAGSLSLLGASIPIQFTINKSHVKDYLFDNYDPSNMVQKICEQIVTKYFASVDLFSVMSSGRENTTKELTQQIQDSCNDHNLGVTIVAVNIQDVHPQVEEVAPSFHDVINAMEEKETKILRAGAYEIKIIPEAESKAYRSRLNAESYSNHMIKVSDAEAERFGKQLLAYNAMPTLFKLRTYLDFLERDCQDIRKYIFSKSMPYEIYEINLEEKERLDLLDADLGSIPK
ncbi:MAG: SPFH domain-containing protein [Victivallales bacterium]|nr:SPFH domain-containing protein [Victivallales bacterium]